jgi:hypothetical protein
VVHEPSPVVQLRKFHAIYETRSFITVFTRARHWIPSWARLIQSTPSNPIYLTFFSRLRLGLLRRSFLQASNQTFIRISHLSHARYSHRPSYPPWFDPTIFSEEQVYITKLHIMDISSTVFIRSMSEHVYFSVCRYLYLPTSPHGAASQSRSSSSSSLPWEPQISHSRLCNSLDKTHSYITKSIQRDITNVMLERDIHSNADLGFPSPFQSPPISASSMCHLKSWARTSESHVLGIVQWSMYCLSVN